MILFVSIIHIALLHEFGSNNPLGIPNPQDNTPFSPYYVLKDFFSLIFVFFAMGLIVFWVPDLLGHSDNYIKANFLVTPAHIVPEWYFLPLYAVLRSVTHKLLGILLLALFILVILLLPYLCKHQLIRTTLFRPIHGFFFWIFFVNCLLLG